MKIETGSAVMSAAQGMGAPDPLHISVSLTVGVLVALAAGILHRSDAPDPAFPTVRYSVPAAVARAGIALCGTASLTLSILMSKERGTSLLILLVSAVAGVVYGLLTHYDSTASNSGIRSAIWRGLTATASACALGQGFLALYFSK